VTTVQRIRFACDNCALQIGFMLCYVMLCPALPRVMRPKYCSFSFATLSINSLSRPNSVNIESFVRCSCHEMLRIFLQHHILKASILFLSDFFKVHPSTPYWNTAHTIDFITLTFVAVFIFRSSRHWPVQ